MSREWPYNGIVTPKQGRTAVGDIRRPEGWIRNGDCCCTDVLLQNQCDVGQVSAPFLLNGFWLGGRVGFCKGNDRHSVTVPGVVRLLQYSCPLGP